ncbi:MAG: hypothetical protein GX442_19405 [Candidatus Riflebacteria bacterium]|nr:hypothetical protein [Candidatus Riflebacteria bacterium]
MELSPPDAKRFWKLMHSVLLWVNRRHGLAPGVETPQAFKGLPDDRKFRIRRTLFDDLDGLAQYVAANPDGFPPEDLEIVRSWRNRVEGKFFVERFLRKHAIFIDRQDVYGVVGLIDPIEDLLAGFPKPAYVSAILLPFKGLIVIDGLLEPHFVSVGGGIRRSLAETYRRATLNGRIITSLPPTSPTPAPAPKPSKKWAQAFRGLLDKAESWKAGKGDPKVLAPTLNLAKACLALGECAGDPQAGLPSLWERYDDCRRKLTTVFRTLSRLEP